MVNELSFFTAVKYVQKNKTFRESALEKVDNYFYLRGKKAHVIQEKTKDGKEKAVLAETNSCLVARFVKVLSYFTIVLPLAMLITKAILRSTHTFQLIDPKKKLEEGINISNDISVKITQLMPKILSDKKNDDDDEIEWLSTGNNLVFKLHANPELVFKIPRPKRFYENDKLPTVDNQKTNKRFENMIKAKEVCMANQLGLLIIPQAKKFTVNAQDNQYSFIAEQSLNLNGDESFQEHLHCTYSEKLNETVRQLALFVARTGFNDVVWRNIPVLNESQDFSNSRRIALIDVEHMESVVHGFTGGSYESRGLIQCATSEQQINAIIKEAYNQGVPITSKKAQKLKKRRLNELKNDQKLQQMYKNNGIVTGKEPIQVDLDSLELDLTEQEEVESLTRDENGELKEETETITLKKVAEVLIEEINRQIQKSSDTASVKGKRCVVLDINKPPIKRYNGFGAPLIIRNDEEDQKRWIYRIIQALIKKGYLFKLVKSDGHGYLIQA